MINKKNHDNYLIVIEASSDHVMWVELHNVAMATVMGAGQLVRSDKIYMDTHADSCHGNLNKINRVTLSELW